MSPRVVWKVGPPGGCFFCTLNHMGNHRVAEDSKKSQEKVQCWMTHYQHSAPKLVTNGPPGSSGTEIRDGLRGYDVDMSDVCCKALT